MFAPKNAPTIPHKHIGSPCFKLIFLFLKFTIILAIAVGIKNITFVGDVKIIFKTVLKVLKRDDINTDGMDTAEDLCDYLLRTNKITEKEYKEKLKIH